MIAGIPRPTPRLDSASMILSRAHSGSFKASDQSIDWELE